MEGVEGTISEDAEWKLLSEIADDGCGATNDGGEMTESGMGRDAEMSWLNCGLSVCGSAMVARRIANHGWESI